jgi:linoleoyl-CoA desaturase
LKWHLYDDFHDVVAGRTGGHPLVRPRGWDLVTFIGGKVTFFSLAFLVPMLLHPVWTVVGFYTAASFVTGLTLSIVFELAHCVEEAAFPLPREGSGRMQATWSEHQVQSTVDFARRRRLFSWFAGGLNYQVEHHLFPRICHVHYAAIAPVVEQTCADFGVRYVAHETLLAGLASHFRWLRRMGKAAPVSENVPPNAKGNGTGLGAGTDSTTQIGTS